MKNDTKPGVCEFCGSAVKAAVKESQQVCPTCRAIIKNVKEHPESVKKIWREFQEEPILLRPEPVNINDSFDLPDVLDGKRYRTIDRDNNKWYLSISEMNGRPVEVFASTAFDRDHELQSRISNLTTITRLISLILRHIVLNERITMEKCLKQIKRSSRQKNDLPDMLYGVLSRYDTSAAASDEDSVVV